MDYRHRLSWSTSTAPPAALPEGVQREYLSSPGGVLEVLTSSPLGSGGTGEEDKEPLLFVHGGFGSTLEFTNYLQFFSSQGYSCYSLSLRGHEASYKLGFWAMYWTSKHAFALDVVLAIAHIRSKHSKNVIIAGHFSGAGLAQYILDRDMEKFGGFVALAGVPGFGSIGAYLNWVRFDPWFLIRAYCKHFGHPRSPLPSTALVHNAFFSSVFPVQAVREIERAMPEYESMSRSFGTMTKFVSAERDKLMDGVMMQRFAAWYRVAWESIRGKVEEGGQESGVEVVRFGVIEGSGHHDIVMKDVMWSTGAEMVLEWLEGR
ncbi:Alpha/Beta hydrolase protein [Tuber indicum]|nr:Alpha/Beta hydrolase protein [Tuber indicum]